MVDALVCTEWNESAGEGGIDETRGVADSGVLAFSESAISGV